MGNTAGYTDQPEYFDSMAIIILIIMSMVMQFTGFAGRTDKLMILPIVRK
jgi:hypothetical protein